MELRRVGKKLRIIIAVISLIICIPPIVNLLMTFGNAETEND